MTHLGGFCILLHSGGGRHCRQGIHSALHAAAGKAVEIDCGQVGQAAHLLQLG